MSHPSPGFWARTCVAHTKQVSRRGIVPKVQGSGCISWQEVNLWRPSESSSKQEVTVKESRILKWSVFLVIDVCSSCESQFSQGVWTGWSNKHGNNWHVWIHQRPQVRNELLGLGSNSFSYLCNVCSVSIIPEYDKAPCNWRWAVLSWKSHWWKLYGHKDIFFRCTESGDFQGTSVMMIPSFKEGIIRPPVV